MNKKQDNKDYGFYFKESDEGVHLMQPVFMDEGTLCGIGCDNPDLKITRQTIVTCPNCIHILKMLQTVKFKDNTREADHGTDVV
ncbi:MAG: hypothetical protein LBB94_10005 [Clostridiales bacterium]|jgi:hypothetical protein|nr:hypothetical protein [Clostridiales bacterium]